MNSNGFTFLEMIATLAVVSTGAALAASNMSQVTSQAMARQQAEQIRSALMKARDLARSTLDCVDVQISSHLISLKRYAVCSPTLQTQVSDEPVAVGNRLTMDMADPLNDTHITFTASGGTLQPTTQLTARTADGKVFQYTVLSAIGAVRIDL